MWVRSLPIRVDAGSGLVKNMAYWQTIIAILIIGAAGVYVGRRIYLRMRSFLSTTKELKTSCAIGCDKCSYRTERSNIGSNSSRGRVGCS